MMRWSLTCNVSLTLVSPILLIMAYWSWIKAVMTAAKVNWAESESVKLSNCKLSSKIQMKNLSIASYWYFNNKNEQVKRIENSRFHNNWKQQEFGQESKGFSISTRRKFSQYLLFAAFCAIFGLRQLKSSEFYKFLSRVKHFKHREGFVFVNTKIYF